MQALVRVQAHMLARIVVEIRAADIAVELVMSSMDNAHGFLRVPMYVCVRTYYTFTGMAICQVLQCQLVYVYADQPNFVPKIVETGDHINRRAHLFLDTLRESQGPAPPPTPEPRGTSGDRLPKTSR